MPPHISTDGHDVRPSDNIDIRLVSTDDPKFDMTLIRVPIHDISIEHLKRVVQERIETEPYDDKGRGEEVPLSNIHLYWKNLLVTESRMVTDVLSDEIEVLLRGGIMQFGVQVEDGKASRRKKPTLSRYNVVVGSPIGSEDGELDGEEGKPARLDPEQRRVIEQGNLPDKFWDNLYRFVERQLGHQDKLPPDKVVKTFRKSWKRRHIRAFWDMYGRQLS